MADPGSQTYGRRYRTLGVPCLSQTKADWSCVDYDERGRIKARVVTGAAGTDERLVTYDYAVDGNRLKTSVTDPAGTITTTVDLLGRVVRYEDVAHSVTTSAYDQAGRLVTSLGPAGRISSGG